MIRIGTAGWSIRAAFAAEFPAEGTHLQRHADRFNAVEINSSFYRPHRRATYERWSQAVPDDFRFAVKAPETITHERRLSQCEDLVERFTEEAGGLGDKLGVVLVQLPPSLQFDADLVATFFAGLRDRTAAALACEPRHTSWFTGEADALLASLTVARVAADPPHATGAILPGGWNGLAYHRMHGSPRIYWSEYEEPVLEALAAQLADEAARGAETWCIFDNTAAGHATRDALRLLERT